MTKMILTGMSIIFIGILLNIAGQKEQMIDLTPAFIVMLNKASISRIGEIMKVMISRDLNDTADAPPFGRHILPSFRRFKMDQEALRDLVIEDISSKMIPEDFARDAKIHYCWKIYDK
ncbi:hypothetical protein R2103_12235 [Nitrosomonas sp. Is24]|uniref:hypothetical protein n=1 Tax=Nitrosomonas sp. Is24 TaxID=3080533 RepID=UPI00294B3349|nr:hypothetical protein [Nitrosomonas sp. Is24]MDV6342534.1 hypothetical protein [Nitrosomonas sp. Is24]